MSVEKRTAGGCITLVLSNASSPSSSRTMPRLLGGMACAELETGKGAVCWLRGGSAPCSTVLVECTGSVDEIWLDAAGLVVVVAGGCAPSLARKASCLVEGTPAAPESRLAQSRGVMWRATRLLILISISCTRCGKDACGCVRDLLVPKGVCNPQPTKYSLYNARESLYPNVHYESLSAKLTTPDSEMKSPKMSGRGNVECGLPEFRK